MSTMDVDAGAPLLVGIVNPDWRLQRHNTDHVCVLDFATLGQHARNVCMSFAGSRWNYLLANGNLVGSRLWRRPLVRRIALRPRTPFDVLYRYGKDALGLQVARPGPLMSTVGYPSLRAVIERGEDFMQREAEALRAATQDSALLHFHTDVMRELYVRRLPQEASRCLTVPFYLPHLRPMDPDAVRAKFDSDETTLLFVGADGVRKGLHELSEALDLAGPVLDRHRVKAIVVSRDRPTCRRFRSVRHHHRLGRDDVQTLMRQAHLYCMVPRHESFGLVYVEAMAAGCAVIADDDLPRQEILAGGRAGRMVPAGQPDTLARAIVELVEDRARQRALALASNERARACYAPQVVAPAYAAAFARIAGRTRGADGALRS